VPGIGRAAAKVIIAETGAGMSRFPSPAYPASWVVMCPGNHESPGKRRMVTTREQVARMVPTGYGKRGSRPGFPWNPGRLLRSVSVAVVAEGSRAPAESDAIAGLRDVAAGRAQIGKFGVGRGARSSLLFAAAPAWHRQKPRRCAAQLRGSQDCAAG
jgi:Transposase IS116/IS110/IS902 family